MEPPPEFFDDEDSLKDILASCDQYDMEPKHMAPFDPKLLKILKRDTVSKDARQFLPPAAKTYLTDFRRHIEKSEQELEKDRDAGLTLRPYWDPRLRSSPKELLSLLVSLESRNLVSFRRVLKARVGLFTVWKKDGNQRLIIDAREANSCHRSPPTTRLGGLSSMVDLDLSEAGLKHAGFGGVPEVCGNEGDVGDCYYNFALHEIDSWFGIDMPMTRAKLAEHGFKSTTYFDDDLLADFPMEAEVLYYPVFSGMCMGWSWGLYFANEAVAHMVAESAGGSVDDQLREKQVVPRLLPGRPVTSVYVDNVSVIGGSAVDTDTRMDGIVQTAEQRSLPFDLTYQQAGFVLQSLGLVYHFRERKLRHVPNRVWRLYGATRALLRRRRLSSAALRVWLGHAVCVFGLIRPAMSCFSACYRFVSLDSTVRVPIWNSVRAELRMALGLFFLAEVNLGAAYSRDVGCGDSSGYGYALLRREATDAELREAFRYRERWRFLAVPVEGSSPVLGPEEAAFAADAPPRTPVRGGTPCGAGLSTECGRWLSDRSADVAPTRDKWWRHRPKQEVEVNGIPPLEAVWDEREQYEMIVAGRWDHPSEHINIKEARVALLDLRRKCREVRHLDRKHLTLSDSMVTVGVFEKGRSCSFALLSLCRRAAAIQIAGDMQWRLRYIETKRNVADAGSRGQAEEPPPAASPPPPALPSVEEVDPSEFLESRDVSEDEALPPTSSPVPVAPPVVFAPPPGLERPIEASADIRRASKQSDVSEASSEFLSADSEPEEPAPSPPPPPRRAPEPRPVRPARAASRSRAPRLCVPLALVILEIFSGSARFTKRCQKVGFRTFEPMDIVFGRQYDLSRRATQRAVLKLIRSGVVWYVHFGTPCCVWSIARTKVTNICKAEQKEQLGLEFALFTAECCRLLSRLSIFFSIENPATSRLWQFGPIASLQSLPSVFFVCFTMCAFGRS